MPQVGTVDKISTKDINTKYGLKKKYSVQIDGVWYDAGWKKPTVVEGTTVSFASKDTSYGKEIDGGLTPAVAGLGAGTATTTAPKATRGKYDAAPFPVPPLDPSRSIIRQNALRHATATWEMTFEFNMSERNREPTGIAAATLDVADAVIQIAKRYENYISGYDDLTDAQKESS